MKKVKEVIEAEKILHFKWKKKERYKLNFTTHYGFVRSLCTKGLTESIKEFTNNKKNAIENFVQVGIGGSALGATAALKFLKGSHFNFKGKKRYFVLDNLDPERLKLVLSLDPEKTIYHIVSKSGKTVETLSQFFLMLDQLNIPKDNVAITTSKGSFLDDIAKKFGFASFYIPDEVPGRYSVFSPVGLLSLSFFDCDIDQFVEGGKNGVRAYRNGWQFPNDFVDFSIGSLEDGYNILVIFSYKDSLFSIGEWFRQLWAESLGKEGKGQTPVLALGVTDQHSQLQLYQDGPSDKAFVFIDKEACCDYTVKDDLGFGILKGKSISTLMNIEKHATLRALEEKPAPVFSIELKGSDEFTLGNLLIALMIATAKSGEVLGVDPFNQPGVELSKKYAREALKNA